MASWISDLGLQSSIAETRLALLPEYSLADALERGKPYFGRELSAFQSPPVRYALLAALARFLFGKRQAQAAIRVLEVGSWGGASAITLGRVLRDLGRANCELVCVDPWQPYLGQRDSSVHHRSMQAAAMTGNIERLFAHNIGACGLADMVSVRKALSRDVLPGLADRSFDLIYIDGSHERDEVAFDVDQAKRLVAKDGIICGDDLELQKSAVDAEAHAAALQSGGDFVADPLTGRQYHPGVTEAVAAAFPVVGEEHGFWYAQRTGPSWAIPSFGRDALEIPAHLQHAVEIPYGNLGDFQVFQLGSGFVAYPLDDTNWFQNRIQARSLDELIFLLDAIDGVDRDRPPKLVGAGAGSNIVSYRRKAWTVGTSLGRIDFRDDKALGELLASGKLNRADSVDEARDALCRKLIDNVASRVKAERAEIDGKLRTVEQRMDGHNRVRRLIARNFPFERDPVAEETRSTSGRPGNASSFASANLVFVDHDLAAYVEAVASACAGVAAKGETPVAVALLGHDAAFTGALARELQDSLGNAIAVSMVPAQQLKRPDDVRFDLAVVAEPDGEALSSILLSFVSCPTTVIAPITERHLSRQGAYVVTIPKSGSHLLYELMGILGYCPDPQGYVLDKERPLPGTWKTVAAAHTHLTATFVTNHSAGYSGEGCHPFFSSPVIFMYRNPRDIVVSESHYYVDAEKVIYLAPYFQAMRAEDRLSILIDGDPVIGGLDERMSAYLPWFLYPHVLPVSFEELVGEAGGGSADEQARAIWALQLKLHAPGNTGRFMQQLNGTAGKTATFRKGAIGSHRRAFSEVHWELLDGIEGAYMPWMGYATERDGKDPFPTHREHFRQRPLRLRKVRREAPATSAVSAVATRILKENYHGFNLVACNGQVFALDAATGEVEFGDANSLKQLVANRQLYVADDIQGAKIAVLAHNLDRLDGSLESESSGEPRLIEEGYHGFNLVAHRGRYLALRQTIGAIDLMGDWHELLRRHGADDLLIANSLAELHDDIDGLSTRMRIREQATGEINELRAKIAALTEAMDQSSVHQAEQQQRILSEIARLRTDAEDRIGQCQAAIESLERNRLRAEQASDEQRAEVHSLRASLEEELARLRTTITSSIGEDRSAITALEHTARNLGNDIGVHHERLAAVESNWLIRLGRILKRLRRGAP